MGTRKPTKKLEKPAKPEKKSFFAGLFSSLGGGKKKEAPAPKGKKGTAPLKKGAPGGVKKGAGATGALKQRPPKPVEPPPEELFDFQDDPMAGIESDLLGAFEDASQIEPAYAPPPPPPPPPQMAPPPAPPAPPAAERRVAASAAPPAPAQNSGIFGPDGVDSALDSLFDSFDAAPSAPARAPAPPAPAAAAPAPVAPPPQAPAAASMPAPPMAPPPPPAPPAAAGAANNQDGLVSIGKLLIDQNTLKRIIDNAEKRGTGLYTTTRIISNAKGADLDTILQHIDSCEGVTGSLIVGRDGLVIASSLPGDFDRELVGAIASSMQTNLDVQCKKMKLGPARQVICDTEGGTLMLVSLEVGVLVVMSPSLVGLDITGVLSVAAGLADKA